MLKLDYLAPPADLSDYISAFYMFESDEDGVDDLERADIAQLRVILSGEARLAFRDGHELVFPRAAIFGPRLEATRVIASGSPMRLFGAGLLPAGWCAAIGRPANRYANTITPAAELLGPALDRYFEELANVQDFRAMVDLTIDYARRLYQATPPAPLWFIRATDAWLQSSLAPDLADLAALTGLSQRQIERLAKQHYGAPPKFLVRKYRALRAANLIAHGKADWHDLVDQGFYDQPHLIREVKHFTGMTPKAVRDGASQLSRLTFARAALAGDVKPLVSGT